MSALAAHAYFITCAIGEKVDGGSLCNSRFFACSHRLTIACKCPLSLDHDDASDIALSLPVGSRPIFRDLHGHTVCQCNHVLVYVASTLCLSDCPSWPPLLA